MRRQRLILGFVSLIVLANMQAIDAKQNRKRSVAFAPPAGIAATQYSVEHWCEQFDQIEQGAKIPIKQRDRGALLMLKVFARTCEAAEYAEARGLLGGLAARYWKVADEITHLPMSPEADDMRRGYIAYYKGMAQLCDECAALPVVDAAKNQYRALTGEEIKLLTKRKYLLDQLLATCRCTEKNLRMSHGLPFLKAADCDL